MTIDTWLESASKQLSDVGVSTAKLDAEIILSDLLHRDRSWLIAHSSENLAEAKHDTADTWLARRLNREPLAYIRGFKEFYGRDFIVTPDVLIPRPESEALVELAKSCELKPGEGILDVGTGSGCLGITLKLELPDTEVTLLDISEPALKVAKKNAKKLGADVNLRTQDLFSFTATTKLPGQPFKMVIANLPYVDETWQRSPETKHEPKLALFSPVKGLWHSMNLLSAAHHLLQKDGYLLLEADPRQHDELEHYAVKLGFELNARDGFAVLFSRARLDYGATHPGAPARPVDHFHA